MALNVIFSDVESERRATVVGTNIAPGTPLIVGGRPVVTLTGSGDYAGNAITLTANGVTTTLAGGRGGQSLRPNQATVSPTGATYATTPGTVVYRTAAGDLTLTVGTNVKFGVVEFYRGELSATDTAVTIGVNLG